MTLTAEQHAQMEDAIARTRENINKMPPELAACLEPIPEMMDGFYRLWQEAENRARGWEDDYARYAERTGEKYARLVALGDEMARQIEARWSGPEGCDCGCCTAAKAWRAASPSDDACA